jgi:hypothetical protein
MTAMIDAKLEARAAIWAECGDGPADRQRERADSSRQMVTAEKREQETDAALSF